MATAKKKNEEIAQEALEAEAAATAAKEQEVAEKPAEEPAKTDADAKEEKATAKAGKRSEKSLKEAEEKVAKEERKAAGDTSAQGEAESKTKQKQNPTRSRLARRGKNYRKVAELIEKGKAYALPQALELAAKTSVGKFDGTIELHINLNVDPRQADQNIRGTVSLPHGTGKTVRVAVFSPASTHAAAKKAGADVVGEEDFLQQLDKEQLNFDVLISTPQFMPKLGKYARLLGPRGLMPNPKSGTVTTNVAKAVEEAKAGRVEYRVDKQGIVHQGIGKASFDKTKLHENATAFLGNLTAAKPASIKGAFVKSVAASSSMGPGIKVDPASF